jgi:hypothetical protein
VSKKGFFTIEILLALPLFLFATYILFGYIAQIQKQKSNAEIICAVTSLAAESLELGRAVQETGYLTNLEVVPQGKLKKLMATTRHSNTGINTSIWTIK